MTKPIRLRNEEYNRYIEEYKEKLILKEGELTMEERGIMYRCGVDYGLIIDEKLEAHSFEPPYKAFNIVFRIKGPFTLPEQAKFTTEHGAISVNPFIIHEYASTQRMHSIAEDLYKKQLVTSVVPIDDEYLYEALRETAFTIAMEEVIKQGPGFQIIQIDFDERGHFKAVELDESH